MPEHWYSVPALVLSGRDAKALRCAHCLTRIEGTGPRSVRYMRDHVRLVHDFERVPEPDDSRTEEKA